jgi:hypothetical protein
MAANSEKDISAQAAGLAPAPFAIGFNRNNGESFVYGCLVFGILISVVGVAAQVPYLALGSVIPVGIAYWHYPMIEKGLPQLGANSSGLFVERIGQISWSAIRDIKLKQTSVRNIMLFRLEVLLNRPVEDAVTQAHTFPLWKNFMMRNWKKTRQKDGETLIAIDLHTLTGDPDDILSRIRAFKSA